MGCPFGVGGIGFVMITYGISSSLFSFIGGKLSTITGPILLICIGKVHNVSAFSTKTNMKERVHTVVQ